MAGTDSKRCLRKGDTQEAFMLKWREPLMCARNLSYRDYRTCDLLTSNRIFLITLYDIERKLIGFGRAAMIQQGN